MMSAVAPIWDGNETWLIATGVILWGAFPIAYAILMSALYLPVLFMLAGLILRGVAFEFRHKTERMRGLWDASFVAGSLIAAFMQGTMVGALVQGLAISNGRYIGGELDWVSTFTLSCGAGLCVGYALLGACWLVRKCDGDVRDLAYRAVPVASVGLLAFLITVFAFALREHLQVMGRWLEQPFLWLFPVIAAYAAVELAVSVRRQRDGTPFYMAAIIFAAAFGTLAFSFWPYLIPFSITISGAAAPHASLAFMFWGAGLFLFPLMLLYTAISLAVFRGKVDAVSREY
jgi:cytochrome d ubiquinol oxidase subunit II